MLSFKVLEFATDSEDCFYCMLGKDFCARPSWLYGLLKSKSSGLEVPNSLKILAMVDSRYQETRLRPKSKNYPHIALILCWLMLILYYIIILLKVFLTIIHTLILKKIDFDFLGRKCHPISAKRKIRNIVPLGNVMINKIDYIDDYNY